MDRAWRWVLDIVTRREGAVGFEVQPWRWVVERTFGWFNRTCLAPWGWEW
jgi:transposase